MMLFMSSSFSPRCRNNPKDGLVQHGRRRWAAVFGAPRRQGGEFRRGPRARPCGGAVTGPTSAPESRSRLSVPLRMSPMIKFYFNGSPNPTKVALFLEETGTPYEPIPVDTRKGEQFSAEFLAINPNGKVPAIV